MGQLNFPAVFIVILAIVGAEDFSRCPRQCTCVRQRAKKVVLCEDGGLNYVPTGEIDKDTNILRISAPPSRPNFLTLGMLFLQLEQLEEITITHSNIPAIGQSSFLPGKALRHLDLSHNQITILLDNNFIGLGNLQTLILSDNKIHNIVSAIFRHLSNVTTLSLARNKLQSLSPRNFYMMPKLESLDLSGNPLHDIDPEHLKDLRPLKILNLANCKLTRMHSLLYQQLQNIEELDLSNNIITRFQPDEFRHLKNLKVLRLDGNQIPLILDKTFDGHNLKFLGLSKNEIDIVYSCAFCNASIKELDLSENFMENFNVEALKPLALSLESLNLASNGFTGSLIGWILKPLRLLKTLRLDNVQLKTIPEELLYHNPDIKNLSLASNQLEDISYKVLAPLKQLEVLDLSRNKFKTLNTEFLKYLRELEHFSRIELHSNPWSCTRCHMEHLLRWLNATGLHRCSDDNLSLSRKCARCKTPMSLSGRFLQTLRPENLMDCAEPITQSRAHGPEISGISVLIGLMVIIIVTVALICLVYLRCVKGAVYYTHEDERTHTRLCDSGELNDKTSMYVTSVDIYDDYPAKNTNLKNGIS